MQIKISPRAEKQYKKLPKVNQIILAQKIKTLTSKEVKGREKMRGFLNIFRVRVGDYRIVYKATPKEVYIILIGHRKDVYKVLERMIK